MFIEFSKEWFVEEAEKNNRQYHDEEFTEFVDDLIDRIGSGIVEERSIRLQFPDGTQAILSDEVIRVYNQHTLLINLENSVWKHRLVIMLKPLSDEGKEIVDPIVEELKQHPAFIEINDDLTLIGVIDDGADQCKTCGGW